MKKMNQSEIQEGSFTGNIQKAKRETKQQSKSNHNFASFQELLNPDMHTLKLQQKNLRDEDIVELAKDIENHGQLKSINLWGNFIRDKGAIALAQAMAGNPRLRRLNIGNNPFIQANGINALCQAVANHPKLTHFNFESSYLNYKDATILEQHLKKNTSLRSLQLMHNHFKGVGAASIAKAMQIHPTIKHLGLAQNDIDVSAADELRDLLGMNQQLKTLDLSNNALDAKSMEVMADGLNVNEDLKYLNLSDNNIGCGIKYLFKALEPNTYLKRLDVSHNHIGTDAVKEISQLLEKMRGLVELDLSSNNFGHEGLRLMQSGLSQNQSLRRLNLSSNSLDKNAATSLSKILQNNQHLIYLDLSLNALTTHSLEQLAAGLAQNYSLTAINLNNCAIIDATALIQLIEDHRCALCYVDGLEAKGLQNALAEKRQTLLPKAIKQLKKTGAWKKMSEEEQDNPRCIFETVAKQHKKTYLGVKKKEINDGLEQTAQNMVKDGAKLPEQPKNKSGFLNGFKSTIEKPFKQIKKLKNKVTSKNGPKT